MPCGIYDDARIFDELETHIATIEKSMKSIDTSENMHDVSRWTVNKENHAQKIQNIASEYFLAQRLKPDAKNYIPQLMRLHQIIIGAMHAKQTIDLKYIEELKMLVASYEKLYFAPHDHE
jgi:nickel superoxide dismutase